MVMKNCPVLETDEKLFAVKARLMVLFFLMVEKETPSGPAAVLAQL